MLLWLLFGCLMLVGSLRVCVVWWYLCLFGFAWRFDFMICLFCGLFVLSLQASGLL